MATVFDVAAYILVKKGSVSARKLQLLVYYSQAWSLVWDERPLFKSRIEAWATGPVCQVLHDRLRSQQLVSAFPYGTASALTNDQRETVNSVLYYYGDRSDRFLVDLALSERPWRETREEISHGVNSNDEITWVILVEYYGGLPSDDEYYGSR